MALIDDETLATLRTIAGDRMVVTIADLSDALPPRSNAAAGTLLAALGYRRVYSDRAGGGFNVGAHTNVAIYAKASASPEQRVEAVAEFIFAEKRRMLAHRLAGVPQNIG